MVQFLYSGPSCPPTNSTEGNSKHWPQPRKNNSLPHPFSIHHWTPDGRVISPFTSALPFHIIFCIAMRVNFIHLFACWLTLFICCIKINSIFALNKTIKKSHGVNNFTSVCTTHIMHETQHTMIWRTNILKITSPGKQNNRIHLITFRTLLTANHGPCRK